MSLTGKRARRVRHLLAQKQGFRCCYCKRPFTGSGPTKATIEHRKPKRDGGGNNIENLAAACLQCNQRRGRQIDESRRARDAANNN
jgi:5-methylcytosine-specific restriction endonuclease McrA